jgi:hypothetical protein
MRCFALAERESVADALRVLLANDDRKSERAVKLDETMTDL